MTSLDKDSFSVSALGRQAQSQRETIPICKISSVGRSAYDAVYISEDHTRTAKIGRESPVAGQIYNVKSTLGGVGFGFGTAKRHNPKPQWDPDDVPTNDALDVMPDSQPFKYPRDPSIIIGTEPRGKLKDATLLKSHAVAFYARNSPGPAAIGGEFGPSDAAIRPKLGPARPFGARTHHKGTDWMKLGDNPEEVGPGKFERRDFSMGPQHLSQRRNQMVNEFPKAPKFPRERSADTISLLDAARSCMGKQALAKNRSEPSINFSADNRATRAKTKLCITRDDEGPRGNMPKFVARQPALPPERHIMQSGFG